MIDFVFYFVFWLWIFLNVFFKFLQDKIPENQHRVDLQDNRFHLNTETGTLTIQNPKPSDSAKYICSASNSAGKAPPTSAFVDIRERTKQFGPEYLTGNNLYMP